MARVEPPERAVPPRTVDASRHVLARGAVAGLAVQAAFVGAWAAFAPSSFAADFPGRGWGWIAADGPYNEHLVRDVGVLYLGLAVVSAVGALRPTAAGPRTVGAAWLVVSVPHLVYHARTTEPFETAVAVQVLTSLTVPVVLGLVAVLAPPPGSRPTER